MPRLTVDFGIDLGTTNSVAAVHEGDRVTLIPNREGALTTPSAVHIDRRGRLHVGAGARALEIEDQENTALRFKLTMGQGREAAKHFRNGDRRLLPEELSAEVLKQLRADIRDKRGEEPREIVITIPADFDVAQSAATREAAGLAGFAECTLLQEPIAAALAYGVDKLEESAYWLVYDFGGGTFDAAIIRLDEGLPIVVNHAGNNRLGGSNIDHDIAAQKLAPALARGLPDFDADADFWRIPFAKLRREAERAKIEVCRTRKPFLVVVDEVCKDKQGKPVDIELELTPEDVAQITAPYLAQSLALCRKALEEKGMRPEQIDKVLMVGGSSLSPWVRQGVEAELGRPLEIGIDPMTVVAEGAALFASTLNRKFDPDEVAAGTYGLSVTSSLTVDESPAELIARITAPAGGALDGVTLELIDEAGGWRSGRVPLGEDGSLHTWLEVAEGRSTTFRLELRAGDGTLLPCSQETLTVRWGAGGDVAIPLTQSIGVGLASGPLDVILRRGVPLTARGRGDLRTVRPLRRGDKEPLRIPLYQGTNEGRAVRNRLLITLFVRGDQISRDIPANAEVEVVLTCDRSNKLTAKAFFPQTEDEVEASVKTDKTMPPVDTLATALAAAEASLEKLRVDAAASPDSRVAAALRAVEAQDFPRRIRAELRDPEDMEARGRAERLVRDFAEAVDAVEDALELPKLVAEAEEALARCRESVEDHGSDSHRRRLAALERELGEAVASGSPIRIQARRRDIGTLIADLHENDPGLWVGVFYHLRDERGSMSDQRTAAELIRHGESALESNDLEHLKAIVRQLLGLLPPERRGTGGVGPLSDVDKF